MTNEANGRVLTTTADSVAKASNGRTVTRSISRESFSQSNSSRKPLVYLDRILR